MAEDTKRTPSGRVTPEQRLKYIGFEVFPGKPKDLFKSDKDKQTYLDRVFARRKKGDIIREDCKLLEERVSMGERLVLTVASVVILAALFLPWYSVYSEKVVETTAATPAHSNTAAMTQDSLAAGNAMTQDSLAAGNAMAQDSLAAGNAMTTDSMAMAANTGEAEGVTETSPADSAVAEAAAGTSGGDSNEEIITSQVARKRTTREYETLSGIGIFAALGSVGGAVFSSGFVLMLTGFLYLVYSLLCVVLPILTIYVALGLKGSADETALKLKKYLKYNWIPVAIFAFTMFISFFGAQYASGVAGTFTSIGAAYGPGVFLSTISWGVFVSMAGFLLIALKAVEI